MPISSIVSYLTTADLFLAHWTQVNGTVGLFILPSGADRASLVTLRQNLDGAMNAIVAQNVVYQTAIGTRDNARGPLMEILSQFNLTMRARLPGNPLLRALPRLIGGSPSPGVLLAALRAARDIWTRVNALPATAIPPFSPPLTLPQTGGGGYELAQFTTAIDAFDTSAQAVDAALSNLRIARQTRDDLLGPLKALMVDYRKSLPGILPPGDALLDSMPTVTPAPGSTPAAVASSAAWMLAALSARITIVPEVSPVVPVATYQVRFCSGPGTYKTADESVVGDFANGATIFDTQTGLAAPGSVALFRVYALTATGNEKGGATLKVVRPSSP